MLHQISWPAYTVGIISLVIIYYLYVGSTFYRTEIRTAIHKLSGKGPALKATVKSDLQIPQHDIMGQAEPEAVEFIAQEELSFAPPDGPDELGTAHVSATESNTRLIGDLSEMVTEVRTLIRVINESSESKENFEMLFRLIVQKFPALRGTPYQQQIIDFMMEEGAPEFPFPLTESELKNYWNEEH